MTRNLLLFLFLFLFKFSFSQEDCSGAVTLCGNSAINYTPNGTGNQYETLGGCLWSGEHNSVWYKFTIATSGTLTFNLVPTGPVDYDWAIYGPNVNCNNLGSPIRCNASGYLVPTGMNMTNTNTSSAGGNTDPYCQYMNVVAGQTYYLYLDNWSPTVYTFNLTWGGTATFVSPFTNPTIAPNPFVAPGNQAPNPNNPNQISICSTFGMFDFSTLTAGILNGNPNFTVSYYNSANNASTGTNPITAPINVNTSTTYYYNINYQDPTNPNNAANACKQTGSFVFVNNTIIANITASSTVLCPNGTVTLTSNSASGNTWSTGATTQSITVSSAGTYTLTSSNAFCTSLPASVTITNATNPNIQINGNLVLCSNPSTTLTASAIGSGNTYSWSNGTNGASTTITTPGTYTVTVTTSDGCQFTQSATVTQGDVPVTQNTSLSACSSTSNATFDLISAQNLISTTPGVNFTYYVNLSDAQAGNSNSIVIPNAFVYGNATIYVLVSSPTCKKIAQLQLIVNQIPTPSITASSATICNGNAITLTSNYATGNTWSTGQTSQSITVNSAGTYTLTNTANGCTSSPVSITINNQTNPNIQISGNLVICPNTSTTLTASTTGTGNTYSWSNGTNGASTTISTPGTYTVTVTTSQGCQFTQSATVTQGNVPVAQNSTLSVCSNTTTGVFDLTSAQPAISTTSGATFSFYQNLADANAGNTNTIASSTTYNSGNATVYVLVSNGTCSTVAQLQLNVTQIPNPTITASSMTICAGNPVTLTSNYTTGNTWSTGQTTQNITVNSAGTYTLTVINGTCTSSPVSVTLTSVPDPNIQITGNLNFCQGSSTTLTATATGTGNVFAWSNGTNGPVNTVTTGGNHTVTVTTPEGCQFQESVNVTMNPIPVINISNPSQIDCNNAQATLNASNSIFQTGANIQWIASAGGNIVSGANSLNPVVNSAGTYTLTITNTTGCSASAAINVVNNSNPPIINLNAAATTICEGESVVLTASGAQTYTWTGLTGTGNTQTVSPTITTTYTVTGIGANGCQGNTATITINVVPAIESTLTDIEFCNGESGILDAGSGPNYTYQWSTGATTQTITVNQEGTYIVTIDNGVCSESYSAQANFIKTPTIESVNYDGSTLVIIATDDSNLPLQYSIDGGFTWQDSNIFYGVSNNLEVDIKVRTRGENCETSLSYFTFLMQNVITPNGDGHNDVIDFRSIVNNPGFSAEIFDRYGKLIFKATSKNPVWDGKNNGMILPTSSYWYILKWNNPKGKEPILLNGWILLKSRKDQ